MQRLTMDHDDVGICPAAGIGFTEIVNRLAEYERTGLAPDEIESLNEFEGSNTQKYLLELAKHRWIPVEERLPEENDGDYYDSVIATLSNGNVTPAVYRRYDDKWLVEKEDGGKVYAFSDEVIAWMPLPEPYKGTDND